MILAMETKRTVKSVAQQIADFSRSNHRMPTYEEMLALLAVRSKSVVNFWVNKLLEEGILEKLNTKICIGQGYRGKTGTLGIGSCTRGFASCLQGCPPTDEEIYQFLKKCIQEKEERI